MYFHCQKCNANLYISLFGPLIRRRLIMGDGESRREVQEFMDEVTVSCENCGTQNYLRVREE
jgi:RNase P subunit RPR2